MREIGMFTLILLISNSIITYKGLKDFTFLDKFSFNIDGVLLKKEYMRLITSGFLHVNWTHFLFNMITLYLFSYVLESSIGILLFILLYFSSLIGGNLLALYIHRNHPSYTTIGASGAVCGVIFASIGLFPEMGIGSLFLPVYIPGWLFGIVYVLYSIYGIKTKKNNIGHEAHLGGGIAGLLVAIAIKPSIIASNTFTIALILTPTLFFLILIIKKPHLLLISNPFSKSKRIQTIEDKYNSKKISQQNELNRILDKINEKGYDKLSKTEKEKLDKLSK